MRERIVPELDSDPFRVWESRQRNRFELQDGFVLAFADGTAAHDRVTFNLRIALETAFASCRTFGSDMKLRVSDTVVYYPDAMVVCGVIKDSSKLSTPILVVEVLSPSTPNFDLREKRAAYRSIASLAVYIIAYSDQPKIEIDSRTSIRGEPTSSRPDRSKSANVRSR